MSDVLQDSLEASGKCDAISGSMNAYNEIHALWNLQGPEKQTSNKPADNSLNKESNFIIERDGAKLYSIKSNHKSSNHAGPDAMVLVPKDFDSAKPTHLVVYNHGWNDTASSAVKHADLVKQMENAPPNSVLVVPEWQEVPGSGLKGGLGGKQGSFSKQGTFEGMIQDVFSKTPELQSNLINQDALGASSGKCALSKMSEPTSKSTLDKIADISVISHSAGFNAVGSEIYNNGELSKKINSITMLDSVYNSKQLQPWLESNRTDLESGKKRFINIYGSSTHEESKTLEKDAERILPALTISFDNSSGQNSVSPADVASSSVLFRRTNIVHEDIPKKYVAVELAAEAKRKF